MVTITKHPLHFLGDEVVRLAEQIPEIQNCLKICEQSGVYIDEGRPCFNINVTNGECVIFVNPNPEPILCLSTFVHECQHYLNAKGAAFPGNTLSDLEVFKKAHLKDELSAFSEQARFLIKYSLGVKALESYAKSIIDHYVAGSLEKLITEGDGIYTVFGHSSYTKFWESNFERFRVIYSSYSCVVK
jgi:hypothetical protein